MQSSQVESENQSAHLNAKDQFIGGIKNAPKFMAFNRKIREGYRIGFKNPLQIIKSLFMFHNQSINIWTHLLGAIVMFSIILWVFLVVDKTQLDYQLKVYQTNLEQSFTHYNEILNDFQNVIQKYESKNDISDLQLGKFHSQIQLKHNQIVKTVTEQIQILNTILKSQIDLTSQQKQLRTAIIQKLQYFKSLQFKFQEELLPFLKDQNSKITSKDLKILKDQNIIVKNELNRLVFQYLSLEKETPNPYGVPHWPIEIFMLTATICLGCSAVFHLFYPMSSKAFTYFRRMDYAGVIILITGSGVSPIYYGLYCSPKAVQFYLSIILIQGSCLFLTLIFSWVHQKQNKKYKPRLFAAFGLTYLIPFAHMIINETFYNNFGDQFKFSSSTTWWMGVSFSYLLGLYIYAIKWPQKHYPGKYDLCGSSHQIWHMLVLGGVVFTYLAVNSNYQTRKVCLCPDI